VRPVNDHMATALAMALRRAGMDGREDWDAIEHTARVLRRHAEAEGSHETTSTS
jgi:hypothetical protein